MAPGIICQRKHVITLPSLVKSCHVNYLIGGYWILGRIRKQVRVGLNMANTLFVKDENEVAGSR